MLVQILREMIEMMEADEVDREMSSDAQGTLFEKVETSREVKGVGIHYYMMKNKK